ncbi:ThiF family adenylyltransferase [uncultured Nostoc sp.]|uniref:HesA/MoeB/ThiF family protein n=1 Tax=uncultured Nostoc sp. TaxID=340711 RepID=UPI0035CAEC42
MKDKYFRLRPSVSFVPIDVKNEFYQRFDFFLSNTRRIVPVVFSQPILTDIISKLDGTNSVKFIIEYFGNNHEEAICSFLNFLASKCLIEDMETAAEIAKTPYRRVLNFLGDYISYTSIFEVWNKVKNNHVVIVGLGAVGSWVSILLVQSGIDKLTLIDNDVVKETNLNRSIFTYKDLGLKKTTAISNRLKSIQPNVEVSERTTVISQSDEILNILNYLKIKNESILVINCADFPNVDVTSNLIHKACMKSKIPYIIAGGHNLHLSLIGPTILPYETACFECMALTLEDINAPELKNIRKLPRPQRNIGNLAPLTGISSSFVVNEVIRIASKAPELKPAMVNRRGEYNFFTNKINFIDLPRRTDCPCCGKKK